MLKIPPLIRQDGEFCGTVDTMRAAMAANTPYPIVINGLSGGCADAYICEAIAETKKITNAPSLVLVNSDSERARLSRLLKREGINVREFVPRDLVFHNISASCDVDRERLSVLSDIVGFKCDAVISTASCALTYTIPPEVLAACSFSLSVGEQMPRDTLTARLASLGFARVNMVESAGQFSVRGDIVDVFFRAELSPARIEFFGDEVDRIALFNCETQRTEITLDTIDFLPASEVLFSAEAKTRVLTVIDKNLKKASAEEVKVKLQYEKSMLENVGTLDCKDRYISLIYEECRSLLDYFKAYPRVAIFVLGTNEVKEQCKKAENLIKDNIAPFITDGLADARWAKYSSTYSELERFLSSNVTLHINAFAGGVGTIRTSGIFGFRVRRTVAYGANPSLLFEDLHGYIKGGYRTLILTDSLQGANSLVESLRSQDIFATVAAEDGFNIADKERGSVFVGVGTFSGFELIVPKIAVLSMEIADGRVAMKERRRRRILKKAGGAGQRLMSYADLSVGDYVVHANYGIGLFEGIETVRIDGVAKDYITIQYAGTDKLFVPCDRLELVGKYIGAKDDDGKVKLSKMGGGDWTRAKTKAKNSAKNIAKDLIKLYAERQRLPGFAFGEDTDYEDEFASSFEYEETDSQLIAIEEIKADMMRPVPMNRLLCGDVGFGKTEVALRAAFKAIMAGKQVAILVPTTILALQHYTTATSRFRNYPVAVEMISRFRTAKEQEKILRKTARGEVDILIGTHKLLSDKVSFSDLGLLIIDEEQRFGVAQKEKLKQLAKNVDTLMLSATPIPRTLNMAMNGISDMSILDEAPGERLPVQTYVLEYDDAVIYDACRKELARGGQVLYVYNKIDDIDTVATRLMRAMPNARIATAHGAMDRDEIEDIWQSLVSAQIDILVCTTIIETGVDLPNANTLIIENADRMGLSQLHQIRGRVGRSKRRAYAYFTFKRGKALSDVANKRLTAIREYASFGAGFKVALRDLEIRGAGNLLGAEQHGYIDSVGYDLYIKLLSEAVIEEQGGAKSAECEATVDLKVSAYIPEKYIGVSAQRMEMYKKISLIRGFDDADDITDEFIDRFGEMPTEVETLVKVSLCRAIASRVGICKIEHNASFLLFTSDKVNLSVWSVLFEEMKELSFRSSVSPTVTYRLKRGERAIDAILRVLKEYYKIFAKDEENKNVR